MWEKSCKDNVRVTLDSRLGIDLSRSESIIRNEGLFVPRLICAELK